MNRFFAILFIAFMPALLQAQAKWDLKSNKDGIKIYTAKNENSDFRPVKVECDIAATPAQLLAVLLDISRHEEWVYNTKTSRILKKISDNEVVFYAEVKTHWPFADRDYIAHLLITQPSPGTIVIESHAEPNWLPENKDVIRIKHSDSRWVITAVNNNLVHVDYTVSFDPAGSIPAWLLNMFVTEGPSQTFKKLRERVRMPEYQNAHFDFTKS